MTLVKFNNRPVSTSFNNLIDDFFHPFPSIYRDEFTTGKALKAVPVNIRESEEGYELEVVAPGRNKEDFKIDLENNLLTISAEVKRENEEQKEKTIRKEYVQQSFKRSFTIDESIDTEKISAKYVNGVLTLNLPKKAEVKEPVKQITIQ